jgi:hypothetical protein
MRLRARTRWGVVVRALEEFFRDLDKQWRWPADARIPLRIIGSAALMLQTNYQRGTKDSDVLETANLTDEIKTRLLTIAGKKSSLFERHRLYLEIVVPGLPFLPQGPAWHLLPALNASLAHFEIEVLDVVDVVVSKFKRAHADDMADVAAMVDAEVVPHVRLIERFRSAVELFSYDARASDLPKYIAALHRAERDYFGVPETEIELPEWI